MFMFYRNKFECPSLKKDYFKSILILVKFYHDNSRTLCNILMLPKVLFFGESLANNLSFAN